MKPTFILDERLESDVKQQLNEAKIEPRVRTRFKLIPIDKVQHGIIPDPEDDTELVLVEDDAGNLLGWEKYEPKAENIDWLVKTAMKHKDKIIIMQYQFQPKENPGKNESPPEVIANDWKVRNIFPFPYLVNPNLSPSDKNYIVRDGNQNPVYLFEPQEKADVDKPLKYRDECRDAVDALNKQIDEWNKENPNNLKKKIELPGLSDS